MRITTYDEARRFVQRYHCSTQPRRYAKTCDETWDVRLHYITFLTTKGKQIRTTLHVPCRLLQQPANSKEAYVVTRERTQGALKNLAEIFMRIFETKRGFPGYRGWFHCVEVELIYDPRVRKVVSLARRYL